MQQRRNKELNPPSAVMSNSQPVTSMYTFILSRRYIHIFKCFLREA